MTESDSETLGLIVFTIMAIIFGLGMGITCQRDISKREAVRNGCARWVVSDEGQASFEWLYHPKKEKSK